MGQLEDMAMFIRIVEAGGITKAAEQLNIAKSAVSRRLNDLEKRLNSQLLSRTTRKWSLTEAGTLYYQRALNILDEVSSLNEKTSGIQGRIEGTLKITLPLSFGLMHLTELIDKYARLHNSLNFQIDFSDRHINLIEEGYELAIRIGELQDSSYQARLLSKIRFVICASPAYLNKRGIPESHIDLAQHALLQYGLSHQGNLQLTDAKGRKHRLPIDSKMRANNGDFLLDMAIKGHGIVHIPTFLAYKALNRGELVPLLEHYQLQEINAYAVYPKNRFLSQRSRLLIDFVAQHLGDNPYWDQEPLTYP
ncbi:MAG: LysR family transcriptional regulator [Gammaproteobacteria bacterium]|jgi:DNA-binding transcriptional LysR family regulator|nr:LysR family transcriptional regulator [Gammaproteobacteria bacterium]